jgi:hypothetical protein
MPDPAQFYVSDLVKTDSGLYTMTRHKSAEEAVEFIEKRLTTSPSGSKLYLLQSVATFTVEAKINREDIGAADGG